MIDSDEEAQRKTTLHLAMNDTSYLLFQTCYNFFMNFYYNKFYTVMPDVLTWIELNMLLNNALLLSFTFLLGTVPQVFCLRELGSSRVDRELVLNGSRIRSVHSAACSFEQEEPLRETGGAAQFRSNDFEVVIDGVAAR